MRRGVRHATRAAPGLVTVGTYVLLAATGVSAATVPRAVEPIPRVHVVDSLPDEGPRSAREERAAVRRHRIALRRLRREGRAVRRSAPGRRRRPLVGIGFGVLALGILMMASASRVSNRGDGTVEDIVGRIFIGLFLGVGGLALAVTGLVLVIVGLIID